MHWSFSCPKVKETGSRPVCGISSIRTPGVPVCPPCMPLQSSAYPQVISNHLAQSGRGRDYAVCCTETLRCSASAEKTSPFSKALSGDCPPPGSLPSFPVLKSKTIPHPHPDTPPPHPSVCHICSQLSVGMAGALGQGVRDVDSFFFCTLEWRSCYARDSHRACSCLGSPVGSRVPFLLAPQLSLLAETGCLGNGTK